MSYARINGHPGAFVSDSSEHRGFKSHPLHMTEPAAFQPGTEQSRIAAYLFQLRKDGYRPLTIENHSKILRFWQNIAALKIPEVSRSS